MDQVLYYVLQIIKDEEDNGFRESLDYLYFALGMNYFDQGQFHKSVHYFQQSFLISHLKEEVMVHVGMISKFVRSMVEVGKPSQALKVLKYIMQQQPPLTQEDRVRVATSFGVCYHALKQYRLAEESYLEAVAFNEHTAADWGKEVVWHKICQFYVATGQYKKASYYLKKLHAKSRKFRYEPQDKLEFFLMHFKVDSAQANYPSAIRHYQLYSALKDSLFNETQSKQIEQLGVQYETKKKDQALELNKKDIAILGEQSKAQRSQRNGLIGGTILLVALLTLSYNRYRLKQRSNSLLEAQQQVLHAQQEEIHEKNKHLSELLNEKDSLLTQKDLLLLEKDTLLGEKDQLITEKEWLLKEIHHRVKNNLQLVMSLLNSQAASLKDKSALAAIQESQHRVQAMALIHQKLYQSENVARILMPDYIQEVVAYLHDSYHPSQPVRLNLSVERIELDVTLAVPLGLIINEAITNSFKYAFPEGRQGTVNISLHHLDKMTYELNIWDDGVGLPSNYDPSRSRSLGMTLMHGFSGQLGGELSITTKPGTRLSLLFHEEQLSPTYTSTPYA
jgi:two-component sensor histidine kinase